MSNSVVNEDSTIGTIKPSAGADDLLLQDQESPGATIKVNRDNNSIKQ